MYVPPTHCLSWPVGFTGSRVCVCVCCVHTHAVFSTQVKASKGHYELRDLVEGKGWALAGGRPNRELCALRQAVCHAPPLGNWQSHGKTCAHPVGTGEMRHQGDTDPGRSFPQLSTWSSNYGHPKTSQWAPPKCCWSPALIRLPNDILSASPMLPTCPLNSGTVSKCCQHLIYLLLMREVFAFSESGIVIQSLGVSLQSGSCPISTDRRHS